MKAYEQVNFIKKRMINSVELGKIKFQVLKHMWQKEADKMLKESHKAHCKNTKFKELAKAIPSIPENIQDACLRLYLNAC